MINSLIAHIKQSLPIPDAELADALRSGVRGERFSACWQLAMALSESGESRQSGLLAQRAFALWNGEPEFIDEYLDILRADKDAEGIRKVSKRAGMWMAERGNLMEALHYFNVHHYAYAHTEQGDRYEYDLDILKAIEQLAQKKDARRTNSKKPKLKQGQPLRIAYLLFGAAHANSVLVRLIADFARYHNREQIECLFFSPDISCASRQASVDILFTAGGNLITVNSADKKVCLTETEKMLRDCRPDILVSVAALADYSQYYLFCGCPAAVRIALCYGPPAQYVPPIADFVISATWHPLMDSPCDGAVVEIESTLPVRSALLGKLPEGIEIPDKAVVLMAAGRSEKFFDREYWQAILDVLKLYSEAYFVAIGLTNRPPFLDELLTEDVKGKVYILGWLEDYHELLARADIVIDTFPSGGGLTILDSMSYGIPVVSFKNDYLKPFNQVNWNPGDELIEIPALVIPRGDFIRLRSLLSELIESLALRERLGLECKAHVIQTRNQPERMIRRIEGLYFEVTARIKLQEKSSWTAIDAVKDIFHSYGLVFHRKSMFRVGAKFYLKRFLHIFRKIVHKFKPYRPHKEQ